MAARVILDAMISRDGPGAAPEECQTCQAHHRGYHAAFADGTLTCSRCLPASAPSLRRCAGCRFVLYCTRECQRAHWREHREPCQAIAKVARGMELEVKRAESCGAWCTDNALQLKATAMLALSKEPPSESEDDHPVFSMCLDVDVASDPPSAPLTPKNAKFAHTIAEARCYTFTSLHPGHALPPKHRP
ncbi:hypothetical protein BV25DRAFT_1920739 [Artomyces pyxidatus]|uniref:Uncharacterized protein n=1 Tax=Artomyces pyxidatus TaxID=48021 RepID=A0ACB8SJJ7_9AGAM|nr:hypothetical protein BV25DRAFT_1920739 [Artomyces pyxidatus]